MENRLLRYYERELGVMRELASEFSRRFPKVAGRLGLSELSCVDPHVERLLEGFAFLAGRTHMALDAEFPAFTQQLMELVYRGYVAPTPSIAIAQFAVDPRKAALAEGLTVERGTVLRSRTSLRDGTACEFRTAHTLNLLPIELERIEYTSVLRDIADVRLSTSRPFKALLKLSLRAYNTRFDRLRIDGLPLFLQGGDRVSALLYEQLVACAGAIVMRWRTERSHHVALGTTAQPVRPLGFADEQALLPVTARTLQGYRLIQEYFAFPARYDFVELSGLGDGISRCASDQLELLVPLTKLEPELEGAIDRERMQLFATPIVNLFPVTCSRMPVAGERRDLLVVADRSRPHDFEVHSLTSVTAYRHDDPEGLALQPRYAARSPFERGGEHPQYAIERRARSTAPERRRQARAAPYAGSDVLLTLFEPHDASAAGALANLRQLGVRALCTNRDLPLTLTFAPGDRHFELQSGVPCDHVRCVAGPSAPRSSPLDGDTAWRVVSQLSRNYLSLSGTPGGVEALREMLALYARLGDCRLERQLEGLRCIDSSPVIRPYPGPGPRSFVRGLEIRLECEDRDFSGRSVLALSGVLAAFFAGYAASNSFAETVLLTRERGEVHRWPALTGLRPVL